MLMFPRRGCRRDLGGRCPRRHGRSLIATPWLAPSKTASVKFLGRKVARNAARFASRSSGKGSRQYKRTARTRMLSRWWCQRPCKGGSTSKCRAADKRPLGPHMHACAPRTIQPSLCTHTQKHQTGLNSAYIPDCQTTTTSLHRSSHRGLMR
jgi:hypothetical protein